MKTFLHILFLASIMLLAFSGCKNDEDRLDGPGVLTLDALDITGTKATLCGKLNAPDPVALDFEFGFEVSAESLFTEESTTKLRVKYYDEKHEFTYQLENLVPGTTYYYRAYMINQMLMYKGKSKTIATIPPEITLNKDNLTMVVGGSSNLKATVTVDGKEVGVPVSWRSENENIATVASTSGMVISLSKGTTRIVASIATDSAICLVNVLDDSEIEHTYVDLGLSVKWATFNVGASSPEDYGAYYAWGETEPKSEYYWTTYKWCNGSSSTLTKYSEYGPVVDNKTVLDPEDDVAHVKWGGSWRMPTDEEWTELREQCTWTWTDNYNGTGVKGRIVTAANGNSIFFPAAGCQYGTLPINVESLGYYWSSSLCAGRPYLAWYVYYNSDDVYRYYDSRYDGLSVRPVSE